MPTICPVCGKTAGSGTFICTTCPGLQPTWVHPECGGYTRRVVQQIDPKERYLLQCNNCQLTVNEDSRPKRKVPMQRSSWMEAEVSQQAIRVAQQAQCLHPGQAASQRVPISRYTRASPITVQWFLENYETAQGVSLPRSTLYHDYLHHCAENNIDAINAASFGKLIRSVFLRLKTRRLGIRGNSKYYYDGIRVKPTSPLARFTDEVK